jgi:hypothetical protein
MRVLIIVIALFAVVNTALAQNVGIGTTTPAAQLHIKSTTSSNPLIVDGFGNNTYYSILENGTYRGYWGSFAGNPEDVDFGTGSGTTGKLHLTIQASPRLTINNTGQVGIGTTNPAYLMHVNGGDLFVESSSGRIIFGYNVGGSQWRLGTTGGGADLRWYTWDGVTEVAKHYFQQNGNVGINTGIPVPIGMLEVKGIGATSATNSFVLRTSTGDTTLRMRDDGRMGIGYNGVSYGRTMNLGGSGINFYTANEAGFGGAVFPTDTSLVIWSNSGANNYLILQPSWGNTGIGTYSPNAKFHVNGNMLIGGTSAVPATGYQLSVDGKIIGEEVKVQLSTGWPDYVFGDNYQLMPIEDLERSIRQNRHLPNVPSAAAITAEKGFELGDMSRRLLEKVEELTLYIIQLKKENTSLEERIKKLEKE